MLKLLVVLPIKQQKIVLHFPIDPPFGSAGFSPDRWDGIIASSQWSRQGLAKVKKHVVFQLPSWLSGCENNAVKKLRVVCVCLSYHVSCVKYPVVYHDLYHDVYFEYIYIYIYTLYILMCPWIVDDIAEVKDMPMSPCHFHQKWLGHFGKGFLQPKRRVFNRFCSRGTGMCIDTCIYEYIYIYSIYIYVCVYKYIYSISIYICVCI